MVRMDESRAEMRLAIFFIVIAIIFFCISRLQAMSSSSSKGEWVEGKVLLTGKNIGTYTTRYYGDCYTDKGIVKGRTHSYKNKKRIDEDKEYEIEYQMLKSGRCLFRFTDPGLAANEVHASSGRATLIFSIVCICLAVFIWIKMR